jgi:hypothetical protein
MQEGLQLVNDATGDVNISNARFEYIWQVGRKDMFDGMTAADEVRQDSLSGRRGPAAAVSQQCLGGLRV